MGWEQYPKDVQEKLANNPAMVDAVNKMVKDGYGKDQIMRVTGAPYEYVDARMTAGGRGPRERTPAEHEEMLARLAKARAARKKKSD